MPFLRVFFLAFTLCYFASPTINAQSDAGNPAGTADLSLPAQFDNMVDESNNYQSFKVVQRARLAAFKANLADSLDSRDKQEADLRTTIEQLEEEVAGQKAQLTERDASITELTEEKDGISFLGANMSKGFYNTLVWGLAAILLAGMLFFLARSRYAVSVSKDMEESNTDLIAELEKSKRRRLEVEQDLRRKLLDERNKRNGGGEA